jgi:hypothetical protein
LQRSEQLKRAVEAAKARRSQATERLMANLCNVNGHLGIVQFFTTSAKIILYQHMYIYGSPQAATIMEKNCNEIPI